MISKKLDISCWYLLLLVIILIGVNSLAISYLFLTDNLYYQSFGEQLAINKIELVIRTYKKWQWLNYLFIPIVTLVRVSFTAICLYAGFFLNNLKVQFKFLFKASLLADFVLVLAGLVKLVTLIFFKEVNTLDDMQFQPLSLIELFDKKSVDAMLVYPMSLINIFELLYWLVLARLLTGVVENEKSFGSSLKTVASSYGTGLLLWVLFVMFLTVNLGT